MWRLKDFIIVSRFARRVLVQMQVKTKELEVSLGPDTGDLGLRIGIHSGPVTAGILRGDKARFQLYVSRPIAFAPFLLAWLISFFFCSSTSSSSFRAVLVTP